MQRLRVLVLATWTALVLAACAGPKIDDKGVDKALMPGNVVANADATRGQRVRWGGVIIDSSNLKDTTQLEVLAYPLDDRGLPLRDAAPIGRFLALKNGYLETTDYAQGRMVTVKGEVQGTRTGKVGAADYVYPVVAIDQIHLWDESHGRGNTQFHFGIGIGVGL